MSTSSRKHQLARRLGLAAIAAFALFASPARAYTFGPTVTQTGPEVTVFDWSSQNCQPLNIPDYPVHAFRDATNQVHLTVPHYVNHQMIGPTLDSVKLDCGTMMPLVQNPDPAAYDDREWIVSPYTLDGTTVYALIHNEYQGRLHPGQCTIATGPYCRVQSVTLATSTDSGATYTHTPPPTHRAISPPYQYVPDQPVYGYDLSNIIRGKDGFYYVMIQSEPYQAQKPGDCVARTRRLSDPTSWRAWDGSGYNVEFIDPYTSLEPPEQHVCEPVSYDEIGKLGGSISYNTFLGAYLLVGTSAAIDPNSGQTITGFYYSTSQDLIHWTPQTLLLQGVLPSNYKCGDEHPVQYPSLIDPHSPDRNFNTTGRSMYLYFTKMTFNQYCHQTLDRDLVRVPIEFPLDGQPHGFPRPKGATPLRVSLVQAYQPCTSPNAEHGDPLVAGSCESPAQAGSWLTVGTPDANGFAANSTGSIRLDSKLDNPSTTEDETDMSISATATDVRWAHDFRAYEGELLASLQIRLTDFDNGLNGTDAATTVDFPFSFELPCRVVTSLRRVGSTCSVNTSANAIAPGMAVRGNRAIWQLGQAQLYDGGADGVAGTADNTLFEVEGIFLP